MSSASVPDSSRESSSRSPTSAAIEATIVRPAFHELALDVAVLDLTVEDEVEVARQSGQGACAARGPRSTRTAAALASPARSVARARSVASDSVTSVRATAA